LDGNDYYGGPFASFSLHSFKSFLESAQQAPQPKFTGKILGLVFFFTENFCSSLPFYAIFGDDNVSQIFVFIDIESISVVQRRKSFK
jgi:RAB protein geranylgeranyltransferase component A